MRTFPTILALVLAAAPVLAAPVALACGDDVTKTIAIDPIRPAGTGEADQLLSQATIWTCLRPRAKRRRRPSTSKPRRS
jgi:hypothetical protein